VTIREQSTAANDIARNVERIAQMAEENHAAIANSAQATQELEKLAATLEHTVARFRVG
jgi:methyl-accepting chemotaxis protein